MNIRPVLLAVAIVVPASVLSGAQGPTRLLTGRVVDSAGVPVVYANIEWGSRVTVSDDSGRFSMSITGGRAAMAARRIGFRMVQFDLPPGVDTVFTLVMTPIAQRLSAQVVSAERTLRSLELHGFYGRLHDRRYGTNAGQFITAEEIDRRNPTRISQMFDGRTGIRSVKVKSTIFTPIDGCEGTQNVLCWAPQGLGGCWMTVYLDGIRLRASNPRVASSPTVIDEQVVAGDIAGIEIYTTPGKTPGQYQSLNGTCGVVLLWSK